MLVMEQLNSDVLILIYEKLSVEDQMTVALTCDYFYDIISSSWRRCKNIFLPKNAELNFEKYSTLMGSIHLTVQSIQLGSLTQMKWNVIKQYSYPNVTRLDLWYPVISDDDVTLKMTQIFPNLRSVSLRDTGISGKHIEKWQYLEEFNLSGYHHFQFKYFEKILEKLNLKKLTVDYLFWHSSRVWTSEVAFKKFCNLEEISLGPNNLRFIVKLPHCPNLKVLNFIHLKYTHLLFDIVVCVVKNNDSVTIRTTENLCRQTEKVMVFNGLKEFNLNCTNTKEFFDINERLIKTDFYKPHTEKCSCRLIKIDPTWGHLWPLLANGSICCLCDRYRRND